MGQYETTCKCSMSHLFHATNEQADSYLTSKQRKKRNVMTHLSVVAEIQHEVNIH